MRKKIIPDQLTEILTKYNIIHFVYIVDFLTKHPCQKNVRPVFLGHMYGGAVIQMSSSNTRKEISLHSEAFPYAPTAASRNTTHIFLKSKS
jgi:hypothetical protein